MSRIVSDKDYTHYLFITTFPVNVAEDTEDQHASYRLAYVTKYAYPCDPPVNLQPDFSVASIQNEAVPIEILSMQIERGLTTRRYHIQGYVLVKGCDVKFTQLRELYPMLFLSETHFVAARGSTDQNMDYTCKDRADGRVPGTHQFRYLRTPNSVPKLPACKKRKRSAANVAPAPRAEREDQEVEANEPPRQRGRPRLQDSHTVQELRLLMRFNIERECERYLQHGVDNDWTWDQLMLHVRREQQKCDEARRADESDTELSKAAVLALSVKNKFIVQHQAYQRMFNVPEGRRVESAGVERDVPVAKSITVKYYAARVEQASLTRRM